MGNLPLQPGLAAPIAGGPRANLDQVRETAEDFEAVFLHQMLAAMRQGVSEDSPLGGPDSPFGNLLLSEQAKMISKAGGIGVADHVLQELLKLQETGA